MRPPAMIVNEGNELTKSYIQEKAVAVGKLLGTTNRWAGRPINLRKERQIDRQIYFLVNRNARIHLI